MSDQYHADTHCRYLTQYHVIWCPKFRCPVLQEGRDERLKSILQDICARYYYRIKALEVMPDHVHIFVDAPQTVAPCDIARTLKGLSAVMLLRDDPALRKFYARYGVLWSAGYFISTIGLISADTVHRYIEEQKQNATE